MKSFLFATLATALLATASVQAAPSATAFPFGQHGPADNYGYDRSHRVTPQERARWEAAQRHNDRDDHFDRNQNFGFDRDHKVTLQERRRWELSHNYGYAANHRVTFQERARWEASYRR